MSRRIPSVSDDVEVYAFVILLVVMVIAIAIQPQSIALRAIFAGIILICGLIISWWNLGIDNWFERREADRNYQRWREETLSLPVEEAMRRAEPMLSDPDYFEFIPAEAHDAKVAQRFGPALQSLFLRYAVIRYDWENTHVSCRAVTPCDWDNRYLKIGSDMGRKDLLVLPDDDMVHVVSTRASHPQELNRTTYRSIYHWFLIEFEGYAG